MTAPWFDACPMVDGGAGNRPKAGADSRQLQAMASRNAWAVLAGPACLPGHERQRVEREEGWIPDAARQGARPAPIASAAARHG